ncbi:MAG: ATP synthase F1 subunit delta [Acidimicrobiia bacterium]|nr:ATP synthase F1 subunit delta [Acidimicrobiia bacterium]
MAAEDRIQGYASAIFEIARGEGELERIESELFQIARTFETSAELRESLTDPRLPQDRKQGIVDDLLGSRAAELTVSLVGFIVGLGHSSELPEIVDGFIARAAAERHRAVAEVRSAVELDAETISRLELALAKVTGKQVEVKVVVDPKVLGGIVARVGDTVIDGSVRSRLDTLRDTLQSR